RQAITKIVGAGSKIAASKTPVASAAAAQISQGSIFSMSAHPLAGTCRGDHLQPARKREGYAVLQRRQWQAVQETNGGGVSARFSFARAVGVHRHAYNS